MSEDIVADVDEEVGEVLVALDDLPPLKEPPRRTLLGSWEPQPHLAEGLSKAAPVLDKHIVPRYIVGPSE